jgi:acyl carrier protein
MTDTEILERLKPLITEIMSVPAERIQWNSVLVRDLGAESIDLLDLSFRIEEVFQVTLEANEIEREARKKMPGGVYEKDGFLTDEALAQIAASAPEIDASRLVKGLRKNDLPALLTVGFFVRLIARKMEAREQEQSHA